jgi:hypothetical protein
MRSLPEDDTMKLRRMRLRHKITQQAARGLNRLGRRPTKLRKTRPFDVALLLKFPNGTLMPTWRQLYKRWK